MLMTVLLQAPTYNLKNGNKNNVGDALTVLDENTLQWDQTKGKYSAAHGTPNCQRNHRCCGWHISDSSKDAVNGSQLKATNDDVEANTANIATNTSNYCHEYCKYCHQHHQYHQPDGFRWRPSG